MNDLISRQEAIDAILHYTLNPPYYMNEWAKRLIVAIKKDLMDDIEKIPPAQRWIPVTERLPEDDGSYLVFGRCAPDEDYYRFISNFDTGCEAFGDWVDRHDPVTLGFVDSDFYEQDCVLAWMPLPEPYEEAK